MLDERKSCPQPEKLASTNRNAAIAGTAARGDSARRSATMSSAEAASQTIVTTFTAAALFRPKTLNTSA